MQDIIDNLETGQDDPQYTYKDERELEKHQQIYKLENYTAHWGNGRQDQIDETKR